MLVHNRAIKELAPADYLVIENEHKLLEKYLQNLHDACACSNLDKLPDYPHCDHEIQASCQGRLPSFLFHIIDLAGKHFDHEEAIMLSRPHVTQEYEYFRTHRRAHAKVMMQLNALSDECLLLRNNSNTAEIYNQFYVKLTNIFNEHDRDFDDPFIVSTKQVNVS